MQRWRVFSPHTLTRWESGDEWIPVLRSSPPTNVPLQRVRNIGLVAHIDAGKTTTTERMLFRSGFTRTWGNVDDGDTITDYMDQERERGITIVAAAVTFPWEGHAINLIDTPGHVDFTVEVECSMRVLDGAVVVVDAVAGVQAQTETVWRQASKFHIPRIVFVNKMDRMGSDLDFTSRSLRDRLGIRPLLMQLPLGREDYFRGVVDLVEQCALHWEEETCHIRALKPDMQEEVSCARDVLIEETAEVDDQLAELFLERGSHSIDADTLRAAIRRATLAHRSVPVFCGSALHNKGVEPLLDAIAHYLPSPLDVPPVPVLFAKSNAKAPPVVPEKTGPLRALAFKVVNHRHWGPLVFVRVYSGRIVSRMGLYNASKGGSERGTKLLRVSADQFEEVHSIEAGHIGAVVGLKATATGDTLVGVGDGKPVLLSRIETPKPVFFCAIEPVASKDQQSLDAALSVLKLEDPSFEVAVDSETGQTLLKGMGELHLEILKNRLEHEFGVRAETGKPCIAYHETISKEVVLPYTLDRYIGNKRSVVSMTIKVQPKEGGTHGTNTFSLNKDLFQYYEMGHQREKLARTIFKAVENGVRDVWTQGALLGFPLEGVTVCLEDVPIRGDPTPLAYRTCASEAFHTALQLAEPVLIEPIMKLEVETNGKNTGVILSDLNGNRHAVVRHVGVSGHERIIQAEVPLAEMIGYATALRSMTGGQASFSLEFMHYGHISTTRQETVMKAFLGE